MTMSYESYSQASAVYDQTRIPIGIPILLGYFATANPVLSELVVLDAGCGTASYAIELARRVKRVEGIDASPEMIAQGRKKAHAAGIPGEKLSLSVGDIQHLPFDYQHFDCITVNQVLHHVDDDEAVGYPSHAKIAAEFSRVTRPGGLVIVHLCSQEQVINGFWFRELFPDAFERLRQRIISIPNLLRLLESAGLAHVGSVVPLDAVFQGDAYFDALGPLDETWRRGDSVFALATDTELESGCAQLRAMEADGTLTQFMAAADAQRRQIGQVTFVCCRKEV